MCLGVGGDEEMTVRTDWLHKTSQINKYIKNNKSQVSYYQKSYK